MTHAVDLDELPVKKGFRLRGAQMSRLETFADAAFAFALTLLVISFDEIPTTYQALVDALKSVPAFAASFAIIVMFWVAHRIWSERYGLDDAASTILTVILVFVIMVYVYPLRAMMAASISAMTNGWVPAELRLETFDEARGMFLIYGFGWLIANNVLVLLNRHALRCAERLRLNELEIFDTRSELQGWSLVGLFGLASMLIAATVPEILLGMAGYCYFGLAVVMPVHGRMRRRQRRRLIAGAQPV
jgi:uncharacterized membrane protein